MSLSSPLIIFFHTLCFTSYRGRDGIIVAEIVVIIFRVWGQGARRGCSLIAPTFDTKLNQLNQALFRHTSVETLVWDDYSIQDLKL